MKKEHKEPSRGAPPAPPEPLSPRNTNVVLPSLPQERVDKLLGDDDLYAPTEEDVRQLPSFSLSSIHFHLLTPLPHLQYAKAWQLNEDEGVVPVERPVVRVHAACLQAALSPSLTSSIGCTQPIEGDEEPPAQHEAAPPGSTPAAAASVAGGQSAVPKRMAAVFVMMARLSLLAATFAASFTNCPAVNHNGGECATLCAHQPCSH